MQPNLHFRTVGNGDPIIFLHGLFGTSDNWLTMAKKLEGEGYMSYLIDQRDHGRSDHTQAFNYSLLASDVASFMQKEGISKANIIGHSMGGKTTLQMLNDYPAMVKKAIIIDMGINANKAGHQDIFKAFFAVPIHQLNTREEAEQIMSSHIPDIGTVQFLLKNLSRKKEGGFEWKANIDLIFNQYENILSKIAFTNKVNVPTCFIRGGKSNYVLDSDIADIDRNFANASIVTIEGAGHWVHVDKPNELFLHILQFLQH